MAPQEKAQEAWAFFLKPWESVVLGQLGCQLGLRGGAQDTADWPAFLRFTLDPASVLSWRLWLGRQASHLCRVEQSQG